MHPDGESASPQRRGVTFLLGGEECGVEFRVKMMTTVVCVCFFSFVLFCTFFVILYSSTV